MITIDRPRALNALEDTLKELSSVFQERMKKGVQAFVEKKLPQFKVK